MMTEIDAKAKMKERMAKMRAKKAPVKQKRISKEDVEALPILKELKKVNEEVGAALEAEGIKIPELKPKFWIVKDLADACMIPETEVQYLVYFLNAAIIQAIRTKKSIAHVVWHENRTFEIVHVGDAPTPKADDAFE